MSATAALPDKHHGLPTSAKLLIAFLAAVAVIAVAVAIFAGRGTTTALKPPAPVPPQARVIPPTTATPPVPTSAPATSAPVVATNVANGCLGGIADLDQAVVAAQKSAPITPVGAAEFAATLERWATTAPAPLKQAELASSMLTTTASGAARASLSNTVATEQSGYTVGLSFAAGRYKISAYGGDTATVQWVGTGSATHNGVSEGSGQLGGTLHLDGRSGVWKLADFSGRAGLTDADQQSFIAELMQSGTAYAGGC